MITNGDFFGGKYNADEIKRIMEVNARPTYIMKPFKPYFKKSAEENSPTWRDRREVSNFDNCNNY